MGKKLKPKLLDRHHLLTCSEKRTEVNQTSWKGMSGYTHGRRMDSERKNLRSTLEGYLKVDLNTTDRPGAWHSLLNFFYCVISHSSSGTGFLRSSFPFSAFDHLLPPSSSFFLCFGAKGGAWLGNEVMLFHSIQFSCPQVLEAEDHW